MVKAEVKESVRARLSEVGKDLKGSKIRTRIDSIEKIDGKIKANFSVSGLPHKEEDGMYSDSYREIPKIFNDWAGLSTYAEKFFSATDEKLIKICKSES